MKQITKAQIIKIQVLIRQMQLTENKDNIISSFSNGRTTSVAGLTIIEASDLLKHLSVLDPNDRMRRKIISLAYQAGIIYGDTMEDKKMNEIKLNQFLLRSGTVKKELNKLNKEELVKTVSQFQQILKHNESNQAAKATKQMLSELNIKTSK